jgi:hypothetical protein
MTMNQAARLAACGDGCVIPMVLIKAFAMNWMNFMAGREDSSRDQKVQRFLEWRRIGSDWRASINAALMGEGLPERRQAHTLKDV